MLNSLRKATQGWVAKFLLLLLVLSFGVWGISGQIFGGGGDVVIQAGDTTVDAQRYRLAFDRVMATQSQRLGTRLTREQAAMVGIDNAVRAQMIGSAVLDEQARVMNLGLSEDRLAELIAEDPAFQGPGGQFDRNQFRLILREVGMTEADYIVDRERAAVRQQVVEAVADGAAVPDAFLEALAQYQGQSRDVSFLDITSAALPGPGQPTQAQLQAFFDENASDYRAPEYRGFEYVLLTPETLADPASIDDAAVRAEYDQNRARYTQPETRTIQQIVFPDRAAADAADERIVAGEPFETIAAELGRTMSDITLGTLTRADIPDQTVADAAFAISEPGGVSGVIDGVFGPVLVRVTQIDPASVRPLDAVAEQIRQELATVEARDMLLDIHDAYEDARAGGASMAEAARSLRLDVASVDASDRQGLAPDGKPVEGLPEAGTLLQAVFDAEVGEESPPLNAGREGFLWYEVTDITAERDRTLDEVRDRLIGDWQGAERTRILDQAAQAAAQAVRDGADMAAYAEENGFRSGQKFGLRRGASDADFGAAAIAEVFGVGPGGTGSATGTADDRRLVFHVDAVTNPLGGGANVDDRARQQFDASFGNDLLDQLIAQLQTEYHVRLFPDALQRALDANVRPGS